MQNKNEMSESESLIRRLHKISTLQNVNFDVQVQQFLKLGCDRFNLDVGVLTKITDNKCHFEYLYCTSKVHFKAGDCFDLDVTYSDIALKAKGAVAFEHIKHSAINKHRAYLELKLESYIGIPVKVNNKIFGTLNFSSLEPHTESFTHVDIDALQLMAIWVGHALSYIETTKQLRKANEQLEKLIRIDPITGLYNRKAFQEILEKQILLANRNETSLSIIKLNLDRFNPFKGKFGQLEADKALITAAEIILKKCRNTDIIASFGGEEFVIALVNTDREGALINCDSLSKSIKENQWPLHNFTAKCGVSTYTPTKKEQRPPNKIIEQLIKEVDSALFHSKSLNMN